LGTSDTSPDAARVQLEAQRRLGEDGRLRMALDMSLAARALAAAGIRENHPDWDEQQVRRELLRLAFAPADLPRGFK
jgi:CHASE2 domain-containing sensor protein